MGIVVGGNILDSYLRLYCVLKGLPLPLPKCSRCGGELDTNYKIRKAGRLCLGCFRQRNVERQHNPHPRAGSRRVLAQCAYPIAQQCQVKECNRVGIRHHNNYDKPLDIIWLCPKHHTQLHQIKRQKTHTT